MVIGPLVVQQPIVKQPLHSNKVDYGYNNMFSPSNDLGIPNKTSMIPSSTGYYNMKGYPYYDTQPKNLKYPELYTPVAPSSYAFDGDVAVYPVDTLNVIPGSVPGANRKHELAEPAASNPYQKGASSSEFENLLKFDFDIASLLSLSTPSNKGSQEPQQDNFLIPDPALDLLASTGPQQPSLDSFELTNNVPSSLPLSEAQVDFWNVIDKDTSATGNSTTPLSQESNTPVEDPFVSGFYGGNDQIVSFPADEARLSHTRTPSLDDIFTGIPPANTYSPPQSSQPSPVNEHPTSLERVNSWDDHLKELFEKTFDLSEIDMEYFLPPPTKRAHNGNSEEGSWQHYEASPSTFTPEEPAVQSSPASPDTKPVISPPAQPVDATSEQGGGKAKSAVLFGKHEDEILHKLLVPQSEFNHKPITRDKLISMPVEEFNHLLELVSLSEIEVAFMKEWRRRGKNKVAAQIARKRKREEVTDLDVEVNALRQQKVELEKKYDRLRSRIKSLKERSMSAEDKVYQRQRKLTGKPVSRDTHLIHVTEDGKLLLVPRISSQILMVNNK